MVLAIDIGNSNATLGLAEGEQWLHIWRLPTKTDAEALLFYKLQISSALLEFGVPAKAVSQVVISTVVPSLRHLFEQLAEHLFRLVPLVVGPEVYPRLRLQIARPRELGTDLYANAVAAHYLYQEDCIIVDFGTALTFTTVNRNGVLLGVAIAPGLRTAISALFQKTAQLPEVPLEIPSSPIGKDTASAIQSGILIGYVGLVRHLLGAIRDEVGPQYIAVATGGLSSILHPLRDTFRTVNPNLTLDGLRIIGAEVK